MQIVIKNTPALTAFTQNISDQTGKKIPANSLKTAIAKAYGYDHITALTAALDKEDSHLNADTLAMQLTITSYRQEPEKHVLKLTESTCVNELSSMNKDDAEDNVFRGAKMLLESDNLAKAIVLLKSAGIEDIANILLLSATSSADYEFISKHM